MSYESILRRFAPASTRSSGQRDVARRCGQHLSCQPLIHQTLVRPAHHARSSTPQAPNWTSSRNHSHSRTSAAPPTRRHSRCQLARTSRHLVARAGSLAFSLDHEPLYQTPALLAKKKSLRASERNPWLRALFGVQISELTAHNLVVVDEFGCNLDLTRRYSWAPIGTRAYASVPRNTPANQTVIASLQLSGMGPSMRLSGGTDTFAFAAYIEHVLGPTLRPGQIVLLDNLSAHTAPRIAALVAARGCHVWFLPPYSPDYSPIELAFAKIKAILRKVGARTIECLEQAIAEALSQISPEEAAAFFRHCGYWVPSPMAQAFCS